jgi:hypothetical protein
MNRQSREELWDDADFQPLNLLGKGSADHQTKTESKPDPAFDAHLAKQELERQKLGETRKLHREILKEFPSLHSCHHILDTMDTPEKIRKQLALDVARINALKKPILKKK